MFSTLQLAYFFSLYLIESIIKYASAVWMWQYHWSALFSIVFVTKNVIPILFQIFFISIPVLFSKLRQALYRVVVFHGFHLIVNLFVLRPYFCPVWKYNIYYSIKKSFLNACSYLLSSLSHCHSGLYVCVTSNPCHFFSK